MRYVRALERNVPTPRHTHICPCDPLPIVRRHSSCGSGSRARTASACSALGRLSGCTVVTQYRISIVNMKGRVEYLKSTPAPLSSVCGRYARGRLRQRAYACQVRACPPQGASPRALLRRALHCLCSSWRLADSVFLRLPLLALRTRAVFAHARLSRTPLSSAWGGDPSSTRRP